MVQLTINVPIKADMVNVFKENLTVGEHVLINQYVSIGIKNAGIRHFGMQIDFTIIFV